jgi:hypothetical protein
MNFKNDHPMHVDFSYAFAAPHRLTVALPDSSHKTLLDAYPDYLRMSWTYDNLLDKPLGAFVTPRTDWEVHLKLELDGAPFNHSQWQRAGGWLPVLVYTCSDECTALRLEVVGGSIAAIIRIDLTNQDQQAHRFGLRCEKPGGWSGYNPAWVDPEAESDVLLAGWQARADRILVLAAGADETPVIAPSVLSMAWSLGPGEKRTAWLVRPYQAYQSILPVLRHKDWGIEFEEAKAAWRALIDRAARITIPDPGVQDAFYAGLADGLIMREPVAGGYLGTCPGTEGYRAASSFETVLVAILLDQAGLHAEAAAGYQACIEMQAVDGNWADPLGWGHLMWGASGFKSWGIMEHYRLTGDTSYLAMAYPHMAASSRFQERQRARMRRLEGSERPLTYGLMPRGMGDCGLWDDNDLYGVFIPHNIWAVYADAMTETAAEILGKSEDLPELRCIHQAALTDLLQAMQRGAIQEDGYRWIPGVPGKTSGSRWGVLNAAFPCGLLPVDHELVTGTLRKIEARISPGGIPVHTGWMKDGMWVAITLDNLAEVLLKRGEGDAAARYLYATLNHGTPLYSWCEERGQEAGTPECTGDRQHLWTPLAVGRFIRDALVMEDGDILHLGRGAARQWLGSGQPLGVTGACTHFGQVSHHVQYDAATSKVTGAVVFPETPPAWVKLHLRLPGALKVKSVNPDSGAVIAPDGSGLLWNTPHGECRFEVSVV